MNICSLSIATSTVLVLFCDVSKYNIPSFAFFFLIRDDDHRTLNFSLLLASNIPSPFFPEPFRCEVLVLQKKKPAKSFVQYSVEYFTVRSEGILCSSTQKDEDVDASEETPWLLNFVRGSLQKTCRC